MFLLVINVISEARKGRRANVTRNTKDYIAPGARVLNPFTDAVAPDSEPGK